jgi:hypothetical protein
MDIYLNQDIEKSLLLYDKAENGGYVNSNCVLCNFAYLINPDISRHKTIAANQLMLHTKLQTI